ncbi:hypothetical protein [Arsenicicoccus dermatophilus]|uniref:hypothetical protein n=1 Tax=Arsenicicoccus dermatophilus TaxID=1076331 RepID=UPI001F4CAFBF|nr:hypothetical protein [Arsenicicoccus dermatophilus]MCH8611770.1 hypothetical protein [Arsenicicoccus dermatophilus]
METLDHDGGPVVTVTADLVGCMAEALDGPTRRKARILEAGLVVLAVVAAVVVLITHGGIGWGAAVTPLALAAVLFLADLGRRRTLVRSLTRLDRLAVRYDAGARVVRFPLTGTEHPLDRFRRVRVVGDLLVLERKDNTRTPVPAGAIPPEQRDALVADLTR